MGGVSWRTEEGSSKVWKTQDNIIREDKIKQDKIRASRLSKCFLVDYSKTENTDMGYTVYAHLGCVVSKNSATAICAFDLKHF